MKRRDEVSSGHDAARILRRYLEHEDPEHFVILMLDVKNSVIGIHTVSVGTLNSALVSRHEVFKAAILTNAAGIIWATTIHPETRIRLLRTFK